jgi:hypothetical protein
MSGGITKVNPTLANVSRNFNGRTIMGFTIDLGVNATNFATTEMGPTGAIQTVLDVLRRNVTVIAMSALRADSGAVAGQVFDIMVEGEYGTDTYDGTNSETLAAHLEDEIQTLTSVGVGSVNLSAATVTASTGFPYFA